jgi:hypothetical protein
LRAAILQIWIFYGLQAKVIWNLMLR